MFLFVGDQEYYFDEQDQQEHFDQGKYSMGLSLFPINLANPKQMGITSHSESVQHLQIVKLVYQPCSRSGTALEPLWNR